MKRIGLVVFAIMWNCMAHGGVIPMLFPFEGEYFVDEVPYTNAINLRLQLYDAYANGNLLCEDSNPAVQVTDGYYMTYVGDDVVAGSLSNALSAGEVYVQPIIDGTNQANRVFLAPVSYALRAASIPSNSISSAMIEQEAVQAAHLADGAVGIDKLDSDVDERYLNVSGDAMTGTLDMGRQQITNASSLALCKNPNYSSLPLMTITNYYNILYVRGASTLSLEGAIRAPAFELTENMFSLKCIQHAYDGAVLGTNYTVSFSTPTNVMNEIRVTGHLNMQGSAISNAFFSGDGSGLVNLPATGLTTNAADARYVQRSGDNFITGSLTVADGAYGLIQIGVNDGINIGENSITEEGVFYPEGTSIFQDKIRFSGANDNGLIIMGDETNVIVGARQLLGDWSASGLRVPQQGDISMGTYTNGTF